MKKALLILVALCMLMTAAGTVAFAEDGGTIIVGEYILDTQMSNLNPYVTTGTWNNNFRTLVYDPLISFNPIKGEYVPMLATEWSFNEDMTQLTFKLREGVKWHDGEAFNAEDVVYTYEMVKGTTLDTYAIWDKTEKVEANGDYEVTFTFTETFPTFLAYCYNMYIVPEHLWSKVEDVNTFLNEAPIGTGMFVFEKYTVGTDIQFTANKEYWAGAPAADQLIVEMYNSSPNVTLALMAGDIDCTFGTITMSYVPQLLATPNCNIQIYAGQANWVVSMNMENELLQDVAVRKAMCMAIDQASLISRGEYNAVMTVNPAWLPDLFGPLVNAEANAVLKYDVAGAKQVLEDAGYTLGDDGIYQKDGKRLSFTYHNASGAPAQQMEAGMIQQYLLNIGIEIIPRIATWAELATIRVMGKYDLLQNSYTVLPDAYAALFNFFHSSQTAPSGEAAVGLNHFRYRNPEMDALIEKIGKETDENAKKDLVYEAQMIIANEYIYLPMYNSGGHNPYYDGNRVTGWNLDYPVNSPFCLIGVHEIK